MCYGLQIICLSETWLNDICLYHKIFPDCLYTFRSDTVSSNKFNVAVLTAVSPAAGNIKRLLDLQLYDERSGSKFPPKEAAVYPIVITIPPSPDIKSDVISKYFCIFEKTF
jgi:hypothetical protein